MSKLLCCVMGFGQSRQHGDRSVTLCGYSLGARVVFRCCQELARAGERGQGLVQDVVLLGAPVTTDVEQWRAIRGVVAGRVIHGFSRTDWILRFIYKYAAHSKGRVGGP